MDKKLLVLSSLLLITSLVGCGKKTPVNISGTNNSLTTSDNTPTTSVDSNNSNTPTTSVITNEEKKAYAAFRSAMNNVYKNTSPFSYFGEKVVQEIVGDKSVQKENVMQGLFYSPKDKQFQEQKIGEVDGKEYSYRSKRIAYSSENNLYVGIEKSDTDVKYYSTLEKEDYQAPKLANISKLVSVAYNRLGESTSFSNDEFTINNAFKSGVNPYSDYTLKVDYDDNLQELIINLNGKPSESFAEGVVPTSQYYISETLTFNDGMLIKYNLSERYIDLQDANHKQIETSISYNVSTLRVSGLNDNQLTDAEIDEIKTHLRNVLVKSISMGKYEYDTYYLTTADSFDKVIHEKYLDKYDALKAVMSDETDYDKSKVESWNSESNLIISLVEK